MTSTERELFEVWALEDTMNQNQRDSDGKYRQIKMQWMWQAWQAALRAPVVPQEPTSKQVVLGAGALLGQPEHTADNRHPEWHSAVEKVRKVYLAMLAAAPQPTRGIAIQLPEPVAKIEGGRLKWHIPDTEYSLPVRYLQGTENLYAEQQVRQLLGTNNHTNNSTNS